MGNAASNVSGSFKEEQLCITHPHPSQRTLRPPEEVQLDFDNMPFLQPPQNTTGWSNSHNSSAYPGTPLPPAPSPPLAGTNYNHFGQTIVTQGYTSPRIPSEGRLDHTLNDMDFFASPSASPRYSSSEFSSASAGHHRSGSSIASQLSVLSRQKSQSGSPNESPRSHRHSFHERVPIDADLIDAGVPPPVPPHLIFPQHISSRYDSETEMALAAVDALEEDIDLGGERKLTRPRSRSLSRSLTRRKSLGSESVNSGKSMTTDVYTRKCSSPPLKAMHAPVSPTTPETPGSLLTTKSLESASTATQDLESPYAGDDSLFSLDGYHEGTTKLRVVNLDMCTVQDGSVNGEQPEDRYIIHYEGDAPHKFFIKSKAQLAEEEELRLATSRKRYERYGHKFRARGVM